MLFFILLIDIIPCFFTSEIEISQEKSHLISYTKEVEHPFAQLHTFVIFVRIKITCFEL